MHLYVETTENQHFFLSASTIFHFYNYSNLHFHKTTVMQVVPLQPAEDHAGADIHPAACRGPHAIASEHALMEAAARGEPTQE